MLFCPLQCAKLYIFFYCDKYLLRKVCYPGLFSFLCVWRNLFCGGVNALRGCVYRGFARLFEGFHNSCVEGCRSYLARFLFLADFADCSFFTTTKTTKTTSLCRLTAIRDKSRQQRPHLSCSKTYHTEIVYCHTDQHGTDARSKGRDKACFGYALQGGGRPKVKPR